MTGVEERLRRCFTAAFPDLAPKRIEDASVETVEEWDSLHTVVLVALVEEAFAIRIPAHAYPQLRSRAAIMTYLEGVTPEGH